MADKCPECRSMIRIGATRCRCGWKAPQPGGDAGTGTSTGSAKPQTIPCDLSPCLSAATIWFHSRGAWLNLCHDCYVAVSWRDLQEKPAKTATG